MADDINISIGAVDNRAIATIGRVAQELRSFAAVAAIAAGAAAGISKAIDATVGELTRYADQIRSINKISGESAEATSRLIQVADDYSISSKELLSAQKKLAQEGYSLNIDTIAELSDQYVRLNSGAERQQFLTKHLGAATAEWADILSQGSEAIREQADAVNDMLILDQKAIDQAREYQLAVDNLNDSFMGLKITIGRELVPSLNDFMNSMNFFISSVSSGSYTTLGGTIMAGIQDRFFGGTDITQEGIAGAQARQTLLMQKIQQMFGGSFGIGIGGFGIGIGGQTGEEQSASVAQGIDNITRAYSEMGIQLSAVNEMIDELNVKLVESETSWEVMFTSAEDATEKTRLNFDLFHELLGTLGMEGANVWQGMMLATGQISEEALYQFARIQEAFGVLKALLEQGFTARVAANIVMTAYGDMFGQTQANMNYVEALTGHASGGSFRGWSLIGDAPGGRMTPFTEAVYAPGGAYVLNAAQTRSKFGSGGSGSSYASGGMMPGETDLSMRTIDMLADAIARRIGVLNG